MLFKVLNIGRNTERRFQMAPSKLEAMTTALASLACPAWSILAASSQCHAKERPRQNVTMISKRTHVLILDIGRQSLMKFRVFGIPLWTIFVAYEVHDESK